MARRDQHPSARPNPRATRQVLQQSCYSFRLQTQPPEAKQFAEAIPTTWLASRDGNNTPIPGRTHTRPSPWQCDSSRGAHRQTHTRSTPSTHGRGHKAYTTQIKHAAHSIPRAVTTSLRHVQGKTALILNYQPAVDVWAQQRKNGNSPWQARGDSC
jgi:hypothetical protein